MSTIPDFAAPLAAALDRVRTRAAVTIAAEVPVDVSVSLTGSGIAVTGRTLSIRALTDPRLRDFAGLLR